VISHIEGIMWLEGLLRKKKSGPLEGVNNVGTLKII
jgi:hypothetical protein